jgi:methionine aminopeptidase
VEGVLSHQLKQFVIDGNKVVLSVSNADTKVDDAEFEENEVYAIDIVTSTGEGKVRIDVICTMLSLALNICLHFFVDL